MLAICNKERYYDIDDDLIIMEVMRMINMAMIIM